ncbi:RNA polymerase sigma factor [Sphingobacterium sp. 2149]|uniref:RNA polymerase sigma factor n=1 Tax=Sphingobacterium sp. 2149 TaxID=2817763 RepID=UPI001AE297B2|nr:sigma-70 family RNA polymerase sigma factor [Sphingobacterium sp. 2149]MDR6737885.1 RNA polymerase sigma-70 factor (ECF subfamily) [Sphingobacterium sp. 2149]
MQHIEINSFFIEKRGLLKNFASQFTTDPEIKNDLIQDTMVNALKSIEKLMHNPKVGSWLYVIMRNIYINHYRKTKRTENYHHEYASLARNESTSTNASTTKFILDDIQKALSQLSQENYEIFNMFLEGFKYYEIAEYMQMPEGTIKTRIHFIRKTMKKQLSVYH